jgi:hypothetical protein
MYADNIMTLSSAPQKPATKVFPELIFTTTAMKDNYIKYMSLLASCHNVIIKKEVSNDDITTLGKLQYCFNYY